MRGNTENRAEKYIRNHRNFKRWVAFALCLSLFTGTVTLYLLNKPATAMTEEGAGQVGLVLETADADFEQGLIEQMENGEIDEETTEALEDSEEEESTSDAADSVLTNTETVEESEDGLAVKETENSDTAGKSNSSDDADDSSSASSEVSSEKSAESSVEASSEYASKEASKDASSVASSEASMANASSSAASLISTISASDASSAASSGMSASINASSASSSLSSTDNEKDIEYIEAYNVTATLIDEFGKEIDSTKYSEIALPEFDGELVLNDVEKPPYDNVKVKTGMFKTAVYSYNKAVVGNKVIVGLKKETVEGYVKKENLEEVTDSAAAYSASVESIEEKEPELSNVAVYSYTTDGEEYIPFDQDTVIHFVYSLGNQTEYTYSDDKTSITAKVQVPGAIPDKAELVVTPITSETNGYNYEAYMGALNNNADSIAADTGLDAATYTDDNTLMYDIAFMYEGQEIQPAEGSVSISIEFKEKQLTNDLAVSDQEDITVIHLPIKEEVKEQSEITSTVEATNITSDDIEVKTLVEATAEVNDIEKIEFSEDNFSVFVFVSGTSQKNTWNGNKSITLNDFSGISSLLYYSIVSNVLTSFGHIEGNVRTGTFYTSSDASIFNAGNNRIVKNPITEINVVKTVVNGNDGTFTYGFYTVNDEIVGPNFTITTQNSTGSKKILNTDSGFSSVFTALNNGTTLYIYELDDNGNVIKDGEKNGNYTVSYAYTDILGYDSAELANDHDDNYIGEFESLYGGTVSVGNNYFGTNNNYVGESYGPISGQPSNYYYFGSDKDFCVQNATSEMFTYVDGLKEKIKSDIEHAKEVSISLADAKNYASGSNSTSNLVNVINLVSTTGKLSSDLSAANFASPYIKGLLDSDQYLLINIAVDESKYSNYSFDGQGLYFDYQNPQNGYSELASHLIFNFVNSNRTASYSGTVDITSWSDGLLLAPSATINQENGYFQGEMIGNIVKHGNGNEVHKKTIISGKAVTVNIYNTADGGIVVYKQVDGEPANAAYDGKFKFTIEKYVYSGNWTDVTSSVSTNGITNKYDGDTGLSTIFIPLPSCDKGKTTYFRVKEDASTTVNTLDNDNDYIYISVATDSNGAISSIRYYKVNGNYRYLYSPEYSINKSGASEVTGSDVAFNNTSKTTKITVKKEWNGGSKWAYVYAYICGRAGSNDVYGKVVQLSEANNWTVTVDELPMYNSDGTVIIYRAVEIGQIVNSVDEIVYVTGSDGNPEPANLLYDGNAVGTYSEEYEGYQASYSTDLSEAAITSTLGKDSVTGSERVGAVGELSGTVTITNTYNYSNVTLSLIKYLDGKDPGSAVFTFSVSALKKDGSLIQLADDVTNVGGTISYTTKIENDYVITKHSGEKNEEKNVYFLIKENDPSSDQFTKDDSYIIAKVKDLGLESQYLIYYRVSDATEKANIDSDPSSYIVSYANGIHTINSESDVAFYNTSYSITIKKEWYYSDGTEVAKDVYDTYTPINIAVWQCRRGVDKYLYDTVTLSSLNNWEYTLNNVPRSWNSGNDRGQYYYYIQEYDYSGNLMSDTNAVGYFKIINGTSSAVTNKVGGVDIRCGEVAGTLALVCRNIRQTYSLPETGGIGDLPFKTSGLCIILFALLGLYFNLFMHKKKEHKIQKERTRMKGLKKLLTCVLAGAMALSMAFSTGAAVKAQAAEHTITVKNASKGQKYTLYKLFDYEPSATNEGAGVYKVTDANVKEFLKTQTEYINVDENGYVKWDNKDTKSDTDGKDTAIAAFAKNVQAAISNGTLKLTQITSVTAKKDEIGVKELNTNDANGVAQYEVSFSVSDYGYYLVSSTLGALVSIDTTSPSAEVYEKNTTPRLTKEVKEDSSSYGKKNDAQIGQVVEYQVTVDAKAGGTNYIVHDKMDKGLTFNADSVVVKSGETTLTEGTDYTVVTEDLEADCTFEVRFPNAFTADATVVVTYSAVINSDAVVSTALVNDSYLEYNNKATTEHDSTETYVYAFNLYKNDGNGTALAGAKFTLANGTEALKFVFESTDANGVYVYRVANANEATKAEALTKDGDGKYIVVAGTVYSEIVTPDSGKVYVRGLDADAYTLTETEAPAGYNLLSDPVNVVVHRATENVIDGNYYLSDDENQNENEIGVINKTGSLLPSTGGMGTTLFYIIGGVLIIAGVAYFMVRRKADAE